MRSWVVLVMFYLLLTNAARFCSIVSFKRSNSSQ
uniref:Uncharacterized protein n=1 Tax=Lepeophtheirus salmonis TaxID=72036 RepID=A0A0K2UTJ9_LEPSM